MTSRYVASGVEVSLYVRQNAAPNSSTVGYPKNTQGVYCGIQGPASFGGPLCEQHMELPKVRGPQWRGRRDHQRHPRDSPRHGCEARGRRPAELHPYRSARVPRRLVQPGLRGPGRQVARVHRQRQRRRLRPRCVSRGEAGHGRLAAYQVEGPQARPLGASKRDSSGAVIVHR